MRKIFEINEFTSKCEYFYDAEIEKDFNSNNGYNCRHPEQSETDTNEKTGEEIRVKYLKALRSWEITKSNGEDY